MSLQLENRERWAETDQGKNLDVTEYLGIYNRDPLVTFAMIEAF